MKEGQSIWLIPVIPIREKTSFASAISIEGGIKANTSPINSHEMSCPEKPPNRFSLRFVNVLFDVSDIIINLLK